MLFERCIFLNIATKILKVEVTQQMSFLISLNIIDIEICPISKLYLFYRLKTTFFVQKGTEAHKPDILLKSYIWKTFRLYRDITTGISVILVQTLHTGYHAASSGLDLSRVEIRLNSTFCVAFIDAGEFGYFKWVLMALQIDDEGKLWEVFPILKLLSDVLRSFSITK